MVQEQRERVCVCGGTSEALPLPRLGPFKLPPPCHPPSACPPPTLSSSLHLCAAAAAAAAGCAIPDPDSCTSQGALTPASETLSQQLQTCHRKSQVKKKNPNTLPNTIPSIISRLPPPLALTPFFDPLWGVVWWLRSIPFSPRVPPPPPLLLLSHPSLPFFGSVCLCALSTTWGGGRSRRRGRHSQVLQGQHHWE